MKRILFATSIITILLFIACANSASNTNQQKANDNNQQNKSTLQFTPEEIAYNDSIKDLPMDYVQVVEELNGEIDSPETLKYRETRYDVKKVTQEDVYLDSYDWLCNFVLSSVSDRVNALKDDKTLLSLKFSIKILNKEGKDITPLINFPDKKLKQDSIWNKFSQFIRANPLPDINPNMYKQPIINEGEPLTLTFNTDLLKYIID